MSTFREGLPGDSAPTSGTGEDARYWADVQAVADSLPALSPVDGAAIGVLIGPFELGAQVASAA